MTTKWIVIYPRGDKNFLDVAEAEVYEFEEYALASFKQFNTEKEAAIYAQYLSKKFGIPLIARPTSSLLHILDLEDNDE